MPDAEGSQELARRDVLGEGLAAREMNAEMIALVKDQLLRPSKRQATDAELAFFAENVKRSGLDPFKRQIYGIYRYDSRAGGERMTIQVGIDGFRSIAERTGAYEGQTKVEWADSTGVWGDVWLQEQPPFAARVGIYRKGAREATYGVAHWREYQGKGKMWENMPAAMLAKCAEALALRKAFPEALSGFYSPEEMAQADVDMPPEAVVEEATDVPHDKSPEGQRVSDEIVKELAKLVEAGDLLKAKANAIYGSARTLEEKEALLAQLQADG